ncbi:hypothetical protein STSO111631_10755 [Stackebrandtia soli]
MSADVPLSHLAVIVSRVTDTDELYVRESVTTLTVMLAVPVQGADVAVHDSARAREFVQNMTTVDEILEQLPDCAMDALQPTSRSDLDYVRVGCWGRVTHVVDPGLASDFLHMPLTEEISNQETRFPGARVVGEVYLDMGGEYAESVVSLPGVPRLVVRQWDDGTEATGDLRQVLDALGMVPADVDEDFDPETLEDWDPEPVLRRALDGFDADPWTEPSRNWSVFRVRRPDGFVSGMEEVWFGR